MNQTQAKIAESAGAGNLKSRPVWLSGKVTGYVLGLDTVFDTAQILSWFSQPDRLAESPGQVLKTDRETLVVRRPMEWSGRIIDCVIKYQRYNRLRGLFGLRAVGGFRLAVLLLEAGVPTPRPLLAVEQRLGFAFPQSLLITEYVPNSIHLYGYLRDQPEPANSSFARIKRNLAGQVASVFLGLDKLGLRHRDAKPSNWLVQTTSEGPRLWLIDLDGIRARGVFRDTISDGLVQLASKLLWSPVIHRTDYLRAFRACFVSESKSSGPWKSRFRRLARQAVTRRVLTFAETALSQAGHLRQGQVHA